ncbi:hypothetical protein [uncultured Desulfobacter sp.]|uniref:hypothetical protein n=1 Tax=uncultured Desulfobacter sp. TaxID=240139 RepID=UPI0029F4EF3A|nr:hypothetical protein [uncultured Desulfobacter sp.]
MFHQFVAWLANTVGQSGDPGIVMLIALESSFFPFPSEVVIPPAAYLAATVLGAGLWVSVLAGLGYWFGRNEQLVLQNLSRVTLFLVVACGGLVFFYWRKWRSHSRMS